LLARGRCGGACGHWNQFLCGEYAKRFKGGHACRIRAARYRHKTIR
jgi:hypothetical protein